MTADVDAARRAAAARQRESRRRVKSRDEWMTGVEQEAQAARAAAFPSGTPRLAPIRTAAPPPSP